MNLSKILKAFMQPNKGKFILTTAILTTVLLTLNPLASKADGVASGHNYDDLSPLRRPTSLDKGYTRYHDGVINKIFITGDVQLKNFYSGSLSRGYQFFYRSINEEWGMNEVGNWAFKEKYRFMPMGLRDQDKISHSVDVLNSTSTGDFGYGDDYNYGGHPWSIVPFYHRGGLFKDGVQIEAPELKKDTYLMDGMLTNPLVLENGYNFGSNSAIPRISRSHFRFPAWMTGFVEGISEDQLVFLKGHEQFRVLSKIDDDKFGLTVDSVLASNNSLLFDAGERPSLRLFRESVDIKINWQDEGGNLIEAPPEVSPEEINPYLEVKDNYDGKPLKIYGFFGGGRNTENPDDIEGTMPFSKIDKTGLTPIHLNKFISKTQRHIYNVRVFNNGITGIFNRESLPKSEYDANWHTRTVVPGIDPIDGYELVSTSGEFTFRKESYEDPKVLNQYHSAYFTTPSYINVGGRMTFSQEDLEITLRKKPVEKKTLTVWAGKYLVDKIKPYQSIDGYVSEPTLEIILREKTANDTIQPEYSLTLKHDMFKTENGTDYSCTVEVPKYKRKGSSVPMEYVIEPKNNNYYWEGQADGDYESTASRISTKTIGDNILLNLEGVVVAWLTEEEAEGLDSVKILSVEGENEEIKNEILKSTFQNAGFIKREVYEPIYYKLIRKPFSYFYDETNFRSKNLKKFQVEAKGKKGYEAEVETYALYDDAPLVDFFNYRITTYKKTEEGGNPIVPPPPTDPPTPSTKPENPPIPPVNPVPPTGDTPIVVIPPKPEVIVDEAETPLSDVFYLLWRKRM